jgi:hypothetical protein
MASLPALRPLTDEIASGLEARKADRMNRPPNKGKTGFLVVALIAALGFLGSDVPAASAWFGPARDFPVGDRPASVANGDFNSDSKRDLAFARNTGEVTILLGNGAGRFGKPRDIPIGGSPVAIGVGQFNADRAPDLAVADSAGSRVVILLGNGNGTFGPPTGFATGSFPEDLAVGLLDTDMFPDLAVTTSNGVSVLLGNGDGTFGPAVGYGSGGSPAGVAIGDLDGNSTGDIVYTDRDGNTAKMLLGSGDGTFAPGQTKPTIGTGPVRVAIGDLNRDLKPDLMTANFLSNSVSLLIGWGDGTFRNAKTFTIWTKNAFQVWPNSIVLRDLNLDGVPDPAVTMYRANAIAVMIGNGEGSFARTRLFDVGNSPMDAAIGTFNAGKDPDLAVANRFSNDVSILLNGGPEARNLTLSWQKLNRKFTGTLKSSDPTCVRKQRVTILKQRPGKDRAIVIAVTNRTGGYAYRTGARPGTYYARVRAWSACRFAKSRVVRVRPN